VEVIPLNPVEIRALNGHENCALLSLQRLQATEASLLQNLELTRSRVKSMQADRASVLDEIVKQREIKLGYRIVTERAEPAGGVSIVLIDT